MNRFLEEGDSLLSKPIRKNLGRVQVLRGNDLNVISPIAGARGPQTFLSVLNIESDDELGEGVTIYLQVQPADGQKQTQPVGKLVSFFTARIEWGNGGFQTQALVDIIQGQVISLNAGFVRVTVGPDPQFFVGAALPDFGDFAVAIGAHVSYGTRPAQAFAPTRTILIPGPVGNVGAGVTSAIFEIPSFAKAAIVLAQPDTNPADPDIIQFIDGFGGLIYQRVLSNAPEGAPIPVALDAMFFTIHNAGAVAKKYRVAFELGF